MKYLLITLGILIVLGTGCTQKSASSPKPIQSGVQKNEEAPLQPVSFSTHTPSLKIIQSSKPLDEDGHPPLGYDSPPFRVTIGQTFNVWNGCSNNPTYTDRITLKSVDLKNGKWILRFDKHGPLDIKIFPMHVPSVEDGLTQDEVDKTKAWQLLFEKTKPAHESFMIEQSDPIDYANATGALYESNGAFLPIFVSEKEIYLKYISLAC